MRFVPFILLIIGTIGLLVAELTDWPKQVTLTFAVLNVAGLVSLIFVLRWASRSDSN